MDLMKLADDAIVGLGKLSEIASKGGKIVADAHVTIDDTFPKILTILQTFETVLTDAGPVVDKLKPVLAAIAPLIAMFFPPVPVKR